MTSILTTNEAPTPTRPWRSPMRTVREAGLLILAAIAASWLLNAVTGLDGMLGLYAGLVVSLPLVALVLGVSRGLSIAVDRMMTMVVSVCVTAALIPWLSILFTVVKNGRRAFYDGFLTHDMAITSADDALNLGGASHALVGTLLMVLMASVVAVPMGIVAGLYIVEVKGRFAGMVRFFTQAMSGVPSIVAGLFIYSTVVLLVFHRFNAVAGALALAVLMLPTVARTTEEVLKVVPDELRAASYAVGATQFRTTFRVVLPTVRSGLVTAAMLGVARVAGETAPLLLTSLYFVGFSTNVTGGPMASLPTYIFGNLQIGSDNSVARAWGGSLVLLMVILVLFTTARFLAGRTSNSIRRRKR